MSNDKIKYNYEIKLNPISDIEKAGCSLCNLDIQNLMAERKFNIEKYYIEKGHKKKLSSFISNYLNVKDIDILDIIIKELKIKE